MIGKKPNWLEGAEDAEIGTADDTREQILAAEVATKEMCEFGSRAWSAWRAWVEITELLEAVEAEGIVRFPPDTHKLVQRVVDDAWAAHKLAAGFRTLSDAVKNAEHARVALLRRPKQ